MYGSCCLGEVTRRHPNPLLTAGSLDGAGPDHAVRQIAARIVDAVLSAPIDARKALLYDIYLSGEYANGLKRP